MSNETVQVQTKENSTNGGYTMVIVYSVLIVLLVIVVVWSSMCGDEKFLTKPTRSDLQGDWDIVSELAKLNQIQENILRSRVR